VSSTTGE